MLVHTPAVRCRLRLCERVCVCVCVEKKTERGSETRESFFSGDYLLLRLANFRMRWVVFIVAGLCNYEWAVAVGFILY
ncbi:hypothetical protein TSAR_012054 [Trichomalopsis sarcophagae]|uniref:Uncharacterized protein n=1 Tax=Trichomalopsis sarcophagae TaxID=543379 RepID=A0A232EWC9_9HYME|nr:hypothetical protein TSAR_012054 [Trichomalopsis sarcophagae]